MTHAPDEPLIGYMVIEDYCEDYSDWSGHITYPDPEGANLYWENPIKMIEYSAFEALQNQLEQVQAENRELKSDYWYRKAKGAETISDENKRIYSMLEQKESENQRLREALEFYANNPGNFEIDGAAHSGEGLKIRDRGERARMALSAKPEQNDEAL